VSEGSNTSASEKSDGRLCFHGHLVHELAVAALEQYYYLDGTAVTKMIRMMFGSWQ
jgi:hypothetical protein